MVDQNSQFFAILTNVGAAKQANADALGIPWKITQMGVGDANGTDPTPSAAQTRLINEWRRAPLNQLKVDDKDAAVIVAEQVIPADVGGHWIREIALYDADGDMVAVANCAPTYKPLLSQGSGRTQVVRMNLVVSSASNVQLKIDPSVVLATREYVDAAILAVLPRNKAAGTYGKVTIDARGVVTAGENPSTLAGHGIADAFTMAETNQKVADAISSIRGPVPVSLDQLSKIAAALNNDPQFAVNMLLALAGKASKGTTLAEYGIVDAVPNRNPIANGMDVYGGDLAFLTANAEASIALNCYYTGQQWLRRDQSKSALCLGVSRSQGVFLARAEAGTGPIVWNTSGVLDTTSGYTKDQVNQLLAQKLKQGDFGLGGYAPTFPNNDLNTQYDGTSWFRTIAGCLHAPLGANTQGSLVRHEVWGLGVVQQTFREHMTAREWHRASDSYAFGPWVEVVTNMVGAIQAFATTTPPSGWLAADGSQVLRANYPALLEATQGEFGWGNGSTTFNLPDMRGEVIRGLDNGRGINPGRGIGSIELDAMQGHGHASTAMIIGMSGGSGEFLSHNNGISGTSSTNRILEPVSLAGYGSVRVATETRMRNVALLWCIKY